MEDQPQQTTAQPPAQAPAPASPRPPMQHAQGTHTHASIWLLGILFVLTLLTLVAASIYFIQSNANLMREADIERQEKRDALTMLEEKELEAMELAEELESSEISEDAFIAYGGLISVHEEEISQEASIFDTASATYLAMKKSDWSTGSCTPFADLNEGFASFLSDASLWNDELLPEQLQGILGPEFDVARFIDLMRAEHEAGKIPLSLCEGEDRFFVTMGGEDGYIYWLNKTGFVNLQGIQPISTVNPAFEFYPDVGDGYSVAYTVYGDAGVVGWQFYMINHNVWTSDLVESCVGGLQELSGEGEESYFFSCSREYVPLEEAHVNDTMMMEDDSMMMEENSITPDEN